ncbi:MAG: D-aminoacylase, partial [Candidatus Korarchaeota archaeon]|nr:D-aminoacylase [Candidatus Korarchaeota archaeon]NIU82966.1 amidohydrolase family protein [Candidatus Thorarchaeota archaeon]NIW13389.1 amidohydrolase family protein [Candidatus Thorarchaeota archaeon]NIW51489.1 amidohydrolase family protein [Candidatus Korarchaeota archaeon]
VHSHGDARIMSYPSAPNKVKQGITTILMGNCGSTLAPLSEKNLPNMKSRYERLSLSWDWRSFEEYLDALSKKDLGINVACLVGHGTIRSVVMGYADRKPTREEFSEMKQLLAESLAGGAMGLSTGLGYSPGMYADTEELVALGEILSKYNGIYASHLRNQGSELLEATQEAIEVGNPNDVPIQLSHYKATGDHWDTLDDAFQLIEEHREKGIEVNFDAYPYHASSSSMQSVLPSWAREGGEKEILTRLKDASKRDRIIEEMRERDIDWQTLMLSYSKTYKTDEGKRIAELAEEKGRDPYEFFIDLLLEDDLTTRRVTFCMKARNIPKKLRHPLCSVGSDGGIHTPSLEGKPHPRYYGAFPRVIAKYVREGALRLEDAIRKMTALPAQQIGLQERGIIKKGMIADIVLFDYKTIKDTATFQQPKRFPKGIEAVLVNGNVVVKNGEFTKKRPGKVIKNT